jgi:uncharacterized protein (DUF1499 family)
MRRRAVLLAAPAAAVILGGGLMFRAAEMPAETWHADPEAPGATTGKPNEYRIAPGGDVEPLILPEPPAEVADRLSRAALAEPRTELIAGRVAEGRMTFVQRSRLMGFPDAVSVKVAPEGAGSRLTIWSRSRYGHSDLGVNRARVERWLAAAGLAR